MQKELVSKLIESAKEVLKNKSAEKVLGWKKGLFEDDITPCVFESVEELEKDFTYDENYCGNLCKYLLKQKGHKTAVFLTPKYVFSLNEMIKENRIKQEEVVILDLPENTKAEEDRFARVKEIEAMSADERHEFWKKEFSRCIRCNACRDVCPACTCEKCVFDNNSLYTSQKVAQTSFEESLYHIIRAWHVAGRCTDCGECSRVCPEHIPLYLLNRKFIKDINEIYGEYQAGSDLETKPPMLTFKEDDEEV